MSVKAAAILSATFLLAGCRKEDSLLAPIRRAPLKTPTAGPIVPVSEWREQLRSAYRLHPDARFLLALGEVDRLAGALPAPEGKAASAEFVGGRWILRFGDGSTGSVPELPDFPDLFALLVAHAKAVLPRVASGSPRSTSGRDAFLMPALHQDIDAAERSLEKGDSYGDAARCFARLAFQMPDRLALAPLIPARALALLAAARARDAHAGIEEEILLAHALGYTAHAGRLAATLRPENPLRAFEALDDRALENLGSRPDASEETRYLAIRRTTSRGDLGRWKDARVRFMPGNDSVAVMATGLDLDLPRQVEIAERDALLIDALPRAVLRELARMPSSAPPGFKSTDPFHAQLEGVVHGARGTLWDSAAVRAYYEAAYLSSLEAGRWPASLGMEASGRRLMELLTSGNTAPPDPRGDTRGAPLLLQRIHERYSRQPPDVLQMFVEIRALVPWLDSRPRYRTELAGFSRYQLSDPGAAEDLYRSLVEVLGDVSRRPKAEAAIYVGDTATVHRLLGDPALTVPEATDILWSCFVAKVDPAELEAEYDRLIERFPNDWTATSYFVDFLRSQKRYKKSCEIVERWLARNKDGRTPGRYHAHIRLAHSYVLNGEYQKGLDLLQGMTESTGFEQGNVQRGMAECLAGSLFGGLGGQVDTDDLEILRQALGIDEVIECGDDEALGQIPGSAEDHHGTGRRHRRRFRNIAVRRARGRVAVAVIGFFSTAIIFPFRGAFGFEVTLIAAPWSAFRSGRTLSLASSPRKRIRGCRSRGCPGFPLSRE